MKLNFSSYILKGNQRTILLKKNIIGSFIIKMWTCIVQLLLVPVTLGCLNQYEYGIWLTINSILLWIDSFDIGLGNGLRNRLAMSIATGDKILSKQQISTTFVMLSAIVIPLIIILCFVTNNIDCYALLNVKKTYVSNLSNIIILSFSLVGATFIFKFIGNVYLALQLPAINNLLVALGHTLSLLGIFCLSQTFKTINLMHVALIYTASPLIVYILSYPITFTKYKHLRPSIFYFNKKELHNLFGLGIKFFFIQIGALILFASSNFIISHVFSPKEVTPYQVSFRYFSLVNILFTIISAPLWTATTDAYAKNDWDWISTMTKKMNYILKIFVIVLIIMLALANPIYSLWVGKSVHIPFSMSAMMALYTSVLIYGTCYSNILCGIGKIRLITIITIIEAIIYIPMALITSKYLGLVGIIVALTLVNMLSAITNKIQYTKISQGKANGIWNK